MLSSVLVLLLEDTLHRLARDIARKCLDHHHVAHPLEFGGNPGIDPVHQVLSARAAVAQDDSGDRCFALPRIGHPEHRGLDYRWMLDGHFLDVAGVDVHSTRDDHVLLAVNQEQVSVGPSLVGVGASPTSVDADIATLDPTQLL
jgi:hypothetical protein